MFCVNVMNSVQEIIKVGRGMESAVLADVSVLMM